MMVTWPNETGAIKALALSGSALLLAIHLLLPRCCFAYHHNNNTDLNLEAVVVVIVITLMTASGLTEKITNKPISHILLYPPLPSIDLTPTHPVRPFAVIKPNTAPAVRMLRVGELM